MIDRIANALSRRHLLMGLAASAAAAGAAEAASTSQENPDLLAMADLLPDLAAEYREARDRVQQIVREWSPQWPVPDQTLIRYGEGCKEYRDIEGRGLEMAWGNGGVKAMPYLGTPDYFQKQVAYHEEQVARIATTKSQRGMKFHRLWADRDGAKIEPSRLFWTEVDRITEVSGIKPAQARLTEAHDALKAKVNQIMSAEDWTIAGTVIKAQALQAWAEVEPFWRQFNLYGPPWADQLAASILRHAQAA